MEGALLVLAAALATLHAEWRIVSDAAVYQTDAQIHEFWMRRFQDSALFEDPLTNALLETGYSPPGFRGLYWLTSHFVDPVFFGELLPLVLQPLSVWLVFRIVRDHVEWRPAAWLGAALFLVPWDIHRFSGGHPRAFGQVIVLLAVLLLMRRRNLAAAVVPALGLLLYPPAGVTALVIVLLAAFDPKQRWLLAPGRAVSAAISALGFGAALLATRLLTGPTQELLTAAQAREYPEFGPRGQMHFFASSTLEYLQQNYSGFALRDSGSILAVAALFLLVVRPRNARLLRWEVWCMPIASLALFALAHALLFRLYLPHRYTYALLPFFCIAIAVLVRPTIEAWTDRMRPALVAAALLPFALALVALTVFPLGPQLSLSAYASWLREGVWYVLAGFAAAVLLAGALWVRGGSASRGGLLAAAVTVFAGAVLVAHVAFAGGGDSPGVKRCNANVYSYLRTVPLDAVIAGDPLDLDCVPIAARRPVVISRKLYQPWEVDYFEMIRDRMFHIVRAYYGESLTALVELRTRFGADYLLVRQPLRTRPWGRMAPFTNEFRRLRRSVPVPAVLRLPDRCRTWRRGSFEVYDLACVARASPA
jgi:putative Ca2+/H+ antiporter (TMEM165/GDT1 family)